MSIKSITIKNFRGIEKLENFELSDLSILVGNNGTCKTTILEAINFCLNSSYLAGKFSHTDFYKGADNPIEIQIEFNNSFIAKLPDGYHTKDVLCNKIYLSVKKREAASPNKAFSDQVTITHFAIPNWAKDTTSGWRIKRATGTWFTFDERLLSFPLDTDGLMRSFYFSKKRERELKKGYNSTLSSILDDFNRRYKKGIDESIEKSKLSKPFKEMKDDFEKIILKSIGKPAWDKTFKALNEKIGELDLSEVFLGIINETNPFDGAYLCQKVGDHEIPSSYRGSGIELAVSVLFLEVISSLSKEKIIVLIDEPEMHLHPELQQKFVEYLNTNTTNIQRALSTHSPLFVKHTFGQPNTKINILKSDTNGVVAANIKEKVLSYDSANEVNYIAFNLPTEEYHNELYEELKVKDDQSRGTPLCLKDFDLHVFQRIHGEQPTHSNNGIPNCVSVHTFIRNQIHHRGTLGNPDMGEVKSSIEKMRAFLQAP